MNPNTKLSDLIQQFPKFIDDEDCDILVKWFNDNPDRHIQGQVYGGSGEDFNNQVVLDQKKTTQVYPLPEDSISDLMTRIIFASYDTYSKIHPVPSGQPLCAKDYSLRVYRMNDGYFKKHCDQTAGANSQRIFGFIAYLNDVVEGGETNFTALGVKGNPEKGNVLIFPCNYLFEHEGCVPISGDKYVMTAFINFGDIEYD
jgi:hypothetical protein